MTEKNKMKLTVSYNYEVAAKNIHQQKVVWTGYADDISEIPNPGARNLAKKAIKAGQNQSFGIWKVTLLAD